MMMMTLLDYSPEKYCILVERSLVAFVAVAAASEFALLEVAVGWAARVIKNQMNFKIL